MEEIIKRILDMDKQLRSVTLNVEDLKKSADKDVVKKLAEVRERYEAKAAERIKTAEKSEREHAERLLAQRAQMNHTVLKELNQNDEANRAQWVEEIVRRVTAQ